MVELHQVGDFRSGARYIIDTPAANQDRGEPGIELESPDQNRALDVNGQHSGAGIHALWMSPPVMVALPIRHELRGVSR